ncbi:sheath polysaccharide-degrading enzyme [Kitasatospora paranensis]|uniref:Sheath polysaccharide-degrading enzyme n=1 Tax=Kitasatospora paranensis TaxID=258053 RepID=A0ABW2G6S5_9ACTN
MDDVSLTATTGGTPPPSTSAPASPTPPPSASPSATPTATPTASGSPSTSPSASPTGGGGTVDVSTGKQLQAALDAAVPGQTIRLADGTYTGNFTATARGTATARITLTGSPNAVLTTSTGGGYGLHLNGAAYWTVHGVTVTGAQKGIVVDAADHVELDAVTVHHTTMEGVHFRTSSSWGVLRDSTVHDTGTAGDGKGEGVYVGTANTLTDTSDHVQITGNTIGPNIGGENVDLKEGTTGGLVSGNTFDGSGLTGGNYDDSWVDVKGNGYVIENNTGSRTTNDGYQAHSQFPGWGCGTVFRGNRSDLTGATGTGRYAFDLTDYDAVSCPATVTADNTVTGGDGLVNPGVPVS